MEKMMVVQDAKKILIGSDRRLGLRTSLLDGQIDNQPTINSTIQNMLRLGSFERYKVPETTF